MKSFPNTLDKLLFAMVILGVLGCPPGTKTSVEAGVSVKVDSFCKEDRTSPAAVQQPPDLALLDCPSVEGSGTVRVLFPRKAWLTIRHEGLGAIDAGPGK